MKTKLNSNDGQSLRYQESIREMVDAYVLRACETFMKQRPAHNRQKECPRVEPGRVDAPITGE